MVAKHPAQYKRSETVVAPAAAEPGERNGMWPLLGLRQLRGSKLVYIGDAINAIFDEPGFYSISYFDSRSGQSEWCEYASENVMVELRISLESSH